MLTNEYEARSNPSVGIENLIINIKRVAETEL